MGQYCGLPGFYTWIPRKTLEDPKFMLPFLTPAIYLIERLIFGLVSKIPWMYKIPYLGKLFDSKSMFIGTYLSFPQKSNELNVFKIKFDSISSKYKLNGYVYSLDTGDHVNGDWESEKLDMKTTEPVALSYLYEGERPDKTKVSGHVYIKFSGETPTKSIKGYWLDVDDVGNPDWKRSNYVKVTSHVKRLIVPKAIFLDKEFPYLYIRSLIHKPASIFRAYYARKDELAQKFPRPL